MDQRARDLTALRHEHPAYRIDRQPHHDGTRYTATALVLSTRPWCVITSDPAELRATLGENRQPPAPQR